MPSLLTAYLHGLEILTGMHIGMATQFIRAMQRPADLDLTEPCPLDETCPDPVCPYSRGEDYE